MPNQRALDHIINSRHPLYDWGHMQLDDEYNKFMKQQEEYDFKLVVCYTIYNEEMFLEDSLNDCLKINDLDGIYLLDGAWEGGGKYGISTDKTRDIINQFINDNPQLKIVYDSGFSKPWINQGTKRNHGLNRVEELWGKSYIIIKDGDEVFGFNSGKDNIWLKREIANLFPALIIMKSYAYSKDVSMIGARIIPTGLGIHYHTDKSMIIHNDKCDIVCDYNIDKSFVVSSACFNYDKMFYINYWNLRDETRLIVKDKYATKQVFGERELKKCEY